MRPSDLEVKEIFNGIYGVTHGISCTIDST